MNFRTGLNRSLAATLCLLVFCCISFPQSKEVLTGNLRADSVSPRPNPETLVSVQPAGDLSDVALYNEAVELHKNHKYQEAAFTYMKACTLYAKACTNLGFMFNNGQGVEKSHLLAAGWYERGCDNGNALGCTNLGIMYWKQELSGDSYKRAAELFDQGCRGGDSGGCRELGFIYEHGYGVAMDKARAAELYRLADQLSRVHQIPFHLQDGLVLISPNLNGKSVVMIVDTGATRTTFDRSFLPPSTSFSRPPSADLSSPIGSEKAHTLDFSWDLDGRVIQITALVGDFDFPDGAVGLFGSDLLQTFSSAYFDYAAMVLTLEER
jgi:Sel1 repeat